MKLYISGPEIDPKLSEKQRSWEEMSRKIKLHEDELSKLSEEIESAS